MSDKTFKQQVDKIFKATRDEQERKELILSAHNAELDRIEREMPFRCANCGIEDAGICDRHECVDQQLIDCQVYIQAQKEGM